MLLLRRRSGQSIIIGTREKIIVKVIREENGIITLGIEAPKSTPVDREEVYKKRELDRELVALFEEERTERGHHHVSL